jgi:stromal membrane-associated protein
LVLSRCAGHIRQKRSVHAKYRTNDQPVNDHSKGRRRNQLAQVFGRGQRQKRSQKLAKVACFWLWYPNVAMASQDQLKAQLREIMNIPENLLCVDCGDKRPTWASLIVPPQNAGFTDPLGCFCCYHCSGAHRRMGTHICFVRSTNLDECKFKLTWCSCSCLVFKIAPSRPSTGKEKEVEAMRNGGNVMINKVFEAKLSDTQKTVVKPDKHTELDPRSDFIYDKYQHRKWYDDKLAKRKSTFTPPAPLGGSTSNGNNRESIGGAFDDFFAARTQIAASDDWHDSKHSSHNWHDSRHDSHEWDNPQDVFTQMASNSISATSAFQMVKEGAQLSPKMAKSAMGGLSYTGTPQTKGGTDGRSAMLERMDSKTEMLNTIRRLSVEQEENQNITPQQVIRRKKNRSKDRSDHNQRRGSGDNDARLGRSNSNDRENSDAPTRRRPPGRTPSMSSEDGSQKPRSRRVRQTPSDESQDLPRGSRPKREPMRGMNRTKSMDDSIGSSLSNSRKQRTRSRSVKRGVRRTMSSDHSNHDQSMDVSNRSTTKKPPRRPRSNIPDEQNQSEAKQMDESVSSRRSRPADDSSSRRRRSPKRSSGESDSRTPSPTGTERSRATTGTERSRVRSSSKSSKARRDKSQPRKAGGNAISVRRVATVRDRSPRRQNNEPDKQSPV